MPVAAFRPCVALGRLDLGHQDGALEPGVEGDPAQRRLERVRHDARTGGLVALERLGQLVDRLAGPDQRGATAGHDALLHRSAGGGQRVLNAVLLLLELHLGGGTDLDDGHAAGQLGQALLELLAVPVRVGVVNGALDLRHAALDVLGLAGALDDRRVVLGDDDPAGASPAGRWWRSRA